MSLDYGFIKSLKSCTYLKQYVTYRLVTGKNLTFFASLNFFNAKISFRLNLMQSIRFCWLTENLTILLIKSQN